MKSPNARRLYTYGPPVSGYVRPRRANTSASSMAPTPVRASATMLIGPYAPSEAGSRKTPDPIMLPTTSAVAIVRPRPRRVLAAGGADIGSSPVDVLRRQRALRRGGSVRDQGPEPVGAGDPTSDQASRR